MPRFLVAGAAHLDRLGRFEKGSVAGASNPGHVETVPGGAAFNVASNLALWRAKVSLATIMGRDDAGRSLMHIAQSRGVELHLQQSDCRTATYNAFVEPDGELTLALADMEIYQDFDPQQILPQIRTLTVDDWLIVDANLLPDHLMTLCQAARCRIAGLTVSRAKAPRLTHVLANIDLLITNKPEFLSMTRGMPQRMVDRLSSDLVVTDGGNPLTIIENGCEGTLPVPEVNDRVDVIGAGDALAAMVVLRRSQGWDLPNAAREGIRAAQTVMTTKGSWSPCLSTLGVGEDSRKSFP